MTEVYRGNYEIMFQILQTCNVPTGIIRTKLMYLAFLSYGQLKKYTEELQDQGLIQMKDKCWFLTDKGKHALKLFQELDGIIRT